MYYDYYDEDYNYFMGYSRKRIISIKKYLINCAEIYPYINWDKVVVLNDDKVREVLTRGDGTFVICGDRQVTNWGQGIYECENWEDEGYEYTETEDINVAIDFLRRGA